MTIIKFFKRINLEFKKLFFNNYFYLTKSYSQEGEDIVLSRYLDNVEKGFYIDIGAHHPKRLSNTYFFYKRGWHGINIDPMPGSMKPFNKYRKRDKNLEIGISTISNELNYHIFNEKALNTFSEENAKIWNEKPAYEIKNIIKIKTMQLKDLIGQYKSNNQKIHFMSIDVEGYEEEVIDSNDWKKYRPIFVLLEDHLAVSANFNNIQIVKKMNSLGYELVSKLYYTLIFKDSNV
jgi:FkbM family methyltransferase